MILNIEDPDFLSCLHFSIEQQAFYNFNLLLYCYCIPYKLNTILPDSRKTEVYDNRKTSKEQTLDSVLVTSNYKRLADPGGLMVKYVALRSPSITEFAGSHQPESEDVRLLCLLSFV